MGMRYAFEGFALDADRRELRRGSECVALEPQVFDLLVHLIRRRHAVVSKDELIAEIWKGRIVSDSALDARVSAVRLAVRDSGAEQRLIRTFPRKGVRFVGTVIEEAPSVVAGDEPNGPPLPDRPSLAVLPFANMSADPDQDYFADGMVEDIITGLSRIKWLFVIARNSSFVYKGAAVDVRRVGRELGVRYVLEGGVRKAGSRLRISAQLLEAETGAHLWADTYDGALEDVFDLQDQITEKVVGVVEPSLQRSEIERSRRKHPESLDAYDLYLRALSHMASAMPADARIAAGFLEDALRLNPDYAAAHALLALCHEFIFTRAGLDEADRIAGVRHARAAIASGADDATALAFAAFAISALGKDHEAALGAIDRALALNASCAAAHYFGSLIQAYAGRPAPATANANRALRLSPFDPFACVAYNALGAAAIQEARFDDAASYFAKAVQANPRMSTYYILHASALALAGRLEEARPSVRRLLELEPGFQSRIISEFGFVRTIADRFAEAARLLGMPE
jgi:TolB-like protein/Tfp pilus assembly protein PilF